MYILMEFSKIFSLIYVLYPSSINFRMTLDII
jgi:hypothetical protein